MSAQASARAPAQLPGEAPRGIAADSAAVAFQRAREGGHVVLEMLIAGHQPDQKIWSQLAAEPSGHIELVTVPIGGRIVLRPTGALQIYPGTPLAVGRNPRCRIVAFNHLAEPGICFFRPWVGRRLFRKVERHAVRGDSNGLPPLLKALPIAPSTALVITCPEVCATTGEIAFCS